MHRIARYRSYLPVAAAVACLGLLAPGLGAGQGLPQATPESVGLSSARLARVDELIERAIADEQIVGAVALIARHGRVAYFKPIGMADVDDGEPMRADTIFRIASMTKPVTSLAVMMLFEEGRFLLDDPISKFIPELANPQALTSNGGKIEAVAVRTEITIQHLLTHTSGIIYRFLGDSGARAALAERYRDAGVSDGLSQTEGRIADLSRQLGTVPLLFEPGTQYQYGLSVDVLGYLVEVVSGLTLEEFFEQRIFAPLGMSDTHFFLDAADAERLASVYVPEAGGHLREVGDEETIENGYLRYSASYPFKGPRTYFSGGAGLVSTAADYVRLLQMFLNGGELDGTRLLSRKTVELMTRNGIGDLEVGPGRKFGLGFAIVEDPGRAGDASSPGTYYWGGFFNTRFFVDPAEQLIGIFLSQRYPRDADRLRDRFITTAYQAIAD